MTANLSSINETSESESETKIDLVAIQAAEEKHQALVICNQSAEEFNRYEESCDDKNAPAGVDSDSTDDDEQYTYI